jgi:tripartite-type tricarboxylate transporter receptor subunit TctC
MAFEIRLEPLDPKDSFDFGDTMTFNLSRRQLLVVAAAGVSSRNASAQSTTRIVRLVLPNAAGSGVDALTRAAQPALAAALGATIVVDNQPGAGGVIGLQALARSAADGLTLSIVSNNVVIFPSVLKSIPFKMPEDFTPIAMVGTTPVVLVVNPNNVPARNSKEFVALLKSKPGKLNYGSAGNGRILHLTSAQFLDETGTTANHVPYKGVGPMVTDLIGGQIDFAMSALTSVQGQIASGKLRAIGIGSIKRAESAPDIPTFVEQGLPGYVVEGWFAVLGPKGMGPSEVKRVHDAFVTAFNDPAVKAAMATQGNSIRISTSEEAAATFKDELAKYGRLVKKAGVEPT